MPHEPVGGLGRCCNVSPAAESLRACSSASDVSHRTRCAQHGLQVAACNPSVHNHASPHLSSCNEPSYITRSQGTQRQEGVAGASRVMLHAPLPPHKTPPERLVGSLLSRHCRVSSTSDGVWLLMAGGPLCCDPCCRRFVQLLLDAIHPSGPATAESPETP